MEADLGGLLLSRFSHVRLCDPIDSSPPGSPVPGILQARTLEWHKVNGRGSSLTAQMVKNPPAMRETPVQFLGQEDMLEKGMATHSSILA